MSDAHRCNNRVEATQPIDGSCDHCSQLAPLLAQIAGSEQGSRAWIEREQSVVEQSSGFILDGKQLSPRRLHQLVRPWRNCRNPCASGFPASCYWIREGMQQIAWDRR